jgi:lysozyme
MISLLLLLFHFQTGEAAKGFRTSDKGIRLICHYEGFSNNIYICPDGSHTIGYGHKLTKEEENKYKAGITKEEAIKLLKTDLRIAERTVAHFVKTSINQNQFDALVSFTFNLGSGNFQRSRLLKKVNAAKHKEVPKELMRWVLEKGKPLKGLIRRRTSEGELYRGVY